LRPKNGQLRFMRIIIATDSFKGALPAAKVCAAIAEGIHRVAPDAILDQFPLADGGEGTAEILTHHRGGEMIEITVHDPLMRTIRAQYGWVEGEALAFIDMAQASGLPLLAPDERDPRETNTFGTGELIMDACQRGARKIVLGIGGSATNDAGIGMAAALGYRFLDRQGNNVQAVGGNLSQIARIDNDAVRFDSQRTAVEVITDVTNPLCGPTGATRVYAPQKGADHSTVEKLETGMRQLAGLLEKYAGKPLADTPGAGAAGGLGAGAVTFLHADLRPGIEAVMDYTGFGKQIKGADLILTGEGRLDEQTLHGKLIHGICRCAAPLHIPVIALCGSLEAEQEALRRIGLSAAFSIIPGPMDLDEAIRRTPVLLSDAAAALTGALCAATGIDQ